ncbi:hypothetical protein [Nitrogeniibacter aestuarii]|uniref:hypothetical protein n=1 Tax=Nitrogeniibacter aestuarii TaxID=2815343 RepID=UPI001D11E6CF|nr:hypothetical protein [Nitrogeniibacter aestuarii]
MSTTVPAGAGTESVQHLGVKWAYCAAHAQTVRGYIASDETTKARSKEASALFGALATYLIGTHHAEAIYAEVEADFSKSILKTPEPRDAARALNDWSRKTQLSATDCAGALEANYDRLKPGLMSWIQTQNHAHGESTADPEPPISAR